MLFNYILLLNYLHLYFCQHLFTFLASTYTSLQLTFLVDTRNSWRRHRMRKPFSHYEFYFHFAIFYSLFYLANTTLPSLTYLTLTWQIPGTLDAGIRFRYFIRKRFTDYDFSLHFAYHHLLSILVYSYLSTFPFHSRQIPGSLAASIGFWWPDQKTFQRKQEWFCYSQQIWC